MAEHDEIQVRIVPAQVIYPLRHKVLRPGRPFADCIWAQDDEPTTAHFAAFRHGEVVGVASMAICPRADDPPNTWRLRGMATDPARQGQGIGALVLSACIEHVRAKDGALIWCNARTRAVPFYRKHGFVTVGDEFEIPGVGPHYVMVRQPV
ncbi:MAG TPA: GNAT family N-acetyltransferase [bacterium]|nr:GNAT family N-acetyltransferase [bacterium]